MALLLLAPLLATGSGTALSSAHGWVCHPALAPWPTVRCLLPRMHVHLGLQADIISQRQGKKQRLCRAQRQGRQAGSRSTDGCGAQQRAPRLLLQQPHTCCNCVKQGPVIQSLHQFSQPS
jgi:hypothetical protein